MHQDLSERLDELQRKILSRSYEHVAKSMSEWGGADVLIRTRIDSSTAKWLADAPTAISLQETSPQRRLVITEYSRELSWLFRELGEIFRHQMDNISKYDFYGSLAQAALDYVEANRQAIICDDLLLSVLARARSLLRP